LARIPKRYQEDAWKAFTDWCLEKGLSPVPAHPWTLSAYALALEGHEKPDEIRKHIHAVAKAHLEKSRARPDRHPMLERTLKMIKTREDTQKQNSKLFDEEQATKKKKAKKAAKTKSVTDKKSSAKKKSLRTMSATPKLVSRRKLAK
jgi:hypothetical protein